MLAWKPMPRAARSWCWSDMTRQETRSIAIAAFSTVVEWYDFTIYFYFSTTLAQVFFAGDGGLLAVLAGFAVAYLLRPIGALVLGRLGDRFGRRQMLLWSVALMTFSMAGIALLPSHAQIGAASGWALIALRCLMAFAVGAEYSGVTAYLLESAPKRRRGLVTSLAAMTSEIGALLAVVVSALAVWALSPEALLSWGWRLPFLLGAALAMGIWIARQWMAESPAFEIEQAPQTPLRDLFAQDRRALLRAFVISALASVAYYIGVIYVPVFLISLGALPEAAALRLATLAALVVICVTPVIGALSDIWGRPRLLIGLCLAAILLPAPMFHLMGTASTGIALMAACVLAILAGSFSAIGPVAVAEIFPTARRLTGLAVGATIATTIFGGFAPLLTRSLASQFHQPSLPGVVIAGVAVICLPLLILTSSEKEM